MVGSASAPSKDIPLVEKTAKVSHAVGWPIPPDRGKGRAIRA